MMPPARQRLAPPVAGAQFLGDRKAHAGRDLLGAHEIFVRGVFEVPPSSATRPW